MITGIPMPMPIPRPIFAPLDSPAAGTVSVTVETELWDVEFDDAGNGVWPAAIALRLDVWEL